MDVLVGFRRRVLREMGEIGVGRGVWERARGQERGDVLQVDVVVIGRCGERRLVCGDGAREQFEPGRYRLFCEYSRR